MKVFFLFFIYILVINRGSQKLFTILILVRKARTIKVLSPFRTSFKLSGIDKVLHKTDLFLFKNYLFFFS